MIRKYRTTQLFSMARQDAGVATRNKSIPHRRLQYLLNETYVKIDELKELMRKEATITGRNSHDPTINNMFSRQDYLISLCAELCSERDKRKVGAGSSKEHHSGTTIRPSVSCNFAKPATADQPRSEKSNRDDSKVDGSWYGSLDRSLAKKKKHQIIDKRRRHTKTIGSMAGLDVIKKSAELRPDEQYEIGLPAAPKISSSRSSIFPMTQHQYYTALVESKRKHTYPLEVRPPPVPVSNWGYPVESLDENKNMRKQLQQSPMIPNLRPNLVPLPCRSLGNELAFRHSGKSKKWYETNLDDNPTPTVAIPNPSPSPSMISSTRGSSRGSVASGMDTIDGAITRMTVSSPAAESAEFTSKSSESSESWSGTGNEVTKPFEMADYYKYSTKFRSRSSPVSEEVTVNGLSTLPPSLANSSHSLHVRQSSLDPSMTFRDTNGNPSVGPKLPPKQRRNQNKSISTSSVIFEDVTTGDPSKDVWITNEPTFV